MRKWFLLVMLTGWLAACNDTGSSAVNILDEGQDTLQEAVTDAEVNVVRQSFPQLFEYLKKQDATFSSDSFLLSGESAVETVPAAPVDEARLKAFQKYFIYNSDSSLALDLYSYNYIVTSRNGQSRLEEGGPDSEAAVIDFKDKTRKRIFFGGPAHALWDAKWVGPQELLLIGAESHEGANVIPIIWHINLQDTSIQVYAYEGVIKADISGYKKEKLAAPSLNEQL
jgi:hypothetical protein